ncbi:flagellar hook protein FlgE [Mariprofundus micogutta]|uniref:Flagellar hook protein FlgE n=1 Tax=Mariprofundus micogutta TaxID=1921010 RepID=A0A1L8CM48_9PROT|nr:flagellar hook protein FlgE [Mariprofundus micogutta]GAV20000.1 flagellar hook protein FlgE [Mariprofundus micogutta]
MGIYNALFIGASGLSSFGEAVRVVGDNIANVNSLGFKSQNVNFSDVLSQTVGVTRSNIANQVGNGVRIGSITRDQQQGSLQNTTSPTDMAINGNGLFAMRDPATAELSYTRAGAFILDKDFNLIDGQGNVVQGFAVDATTETAVGNVTDITFSNLAAQAQSTTTVTAGITLDSNAVVLPTGTVFDPTDPTTFHYKTEVNAFDSLGQTHAVSLQFTKVGQDASGNIVWDWHSSVDGGELTGGTAGVATEISAPTASVLTAGVVTTPGTQTVVFGPSGELVQENSPTLTFNWANATPSTIDMNFGNAAGQGVLYPIAAADAQGITGNGLDGTVQMAGSFATRQMTRDGFASGFLDKLETDSAGKIFGVFTNGQRRALFQVALANFPNDAVLSHDGNNLLSETIASGSPVLSLPGAGGMGTISPYALEQSNVDLAAEFVKLIVVQRGYEANSKTILTTDQMLSSLMQVKR